MPNVTLVIVTCLVMPNPCQDKACPPNQMCVSPKSDKCHCKEGFIFDENMEVCKDIDECLLGHDCDGNSTCVNSEESFERSCQLCIVQDRDKVDIIKSILTRAESHRIIRCRVPEGEFAFSLLFSKKKESAFG